MLRVSGADGKRSAAFVYGINGRRAMPWGVGGTSVLCVAAPTQRVGFGVTTGTNAACDGLFALDWNAWAAANPAALGIASAAGRFFQVQAWMRDPTAPKASSLSNAFEFVALP